VKQSLYVRLALLLAGNSSLMRTLPQASVKSGLKTHSETVWQKSDQVLDRLLERLQLDNAAPYDVQGLGILNKITSISI
jgi:hypothetical protein